MRVCLPYVGINVSVKPCDVMEACTDSTDCVWTILSENTLGILMHTSDPVGLTTWMDNLEALPTFLIC